MCIRDSTSGALSRERGRKRAGPVPDLFEIRGRACGNLFGLISARGWGRKRNRRGGAAASGRGGGGGWGLWVSAALSAG
eukprot:3293347-Rhodomonas_salina.1